MPHGPEAATGSRMMIVDPGINKGHHAACKGEYRHKIFSHTADMLRIFVSKQNGYEWV